MRQATMVFVGSGNMGRSLMGGLIKDGYPPTKIWATDHHPETLHRLHQQWGIHTASDNTLAAAKADVLVLAVKPHSIPGVIEELAAIVESKKPLILSVAAGVPIALLQRGLGSDTAIVRCMPNTPALVGCGATGLYANALVTDAQQQLAESIMRAVGVTVWLSQEEQLDTVTALSGSGPAYFLLMMEALEKAAIDLGLPAEIAHVLTLQTALGAARLAMESDEDVMMLRQRVTSPGGTTEQAIKVLETGKIHHLLSEAVRAAKNRSAELGAELK